MTVQELRIGNLIQDRNGVIMRVVSIHEDGTIHCDFDGNEGDVWEFSDKNPCYGVELTEEILLKCGFVLLDKDYDSQNFNIYKLGNLYYNTSHNAFWYYNIYCFNQPKYLHELQNLFYFIVDYEINFKK